MWDLDDACAGSALQRLNLYASDVRTGLRNSCYRFGSAVLGIGAFGRLSSSFDQDR